MVSGDDSRRSLGLMITSRLVVKDAAEVISVREDVGLMWKVCTSRVDKVDTGES